MVDILGRIEKKLQETGLSASAASLAAGLSKDAIRNIRRAKLQGIDAGVNVRTIEALAPVLKTSKAWLLGENDQQQETSDDHIPLFEMAELPRRRQDVLSGIVGAAAKDGRGVRISFSKANVIAIRLLDHSMSQFIPKDSIVLVDVSQVMLKKKGIYVIAVNESEVVLRAFEDDPDRFVPSSVIPGFESYFDMSALEVVGRAVAVYREI